MEAYKKELEEYNKSAAATLDHKLEDWNMMFNEWCSSAALNILYLLSVW